MADTIRRLIAAIVSSIAGLAIVTALGCNSGFWEGKECEGATDRAYGVLTGLLTTVIGLSVKLDALEGSKVTRNQTRKASGAKAQPARERSVDPEARQS